MSKLAISLLGRFSVLHNGDEVSGFQSDKARALLAYLFVESGLRHRRERLAGLFWPEWPDANARANLRHAINNLRSILGDKSAAPQLLLADRQTIQINPDYNCSFDVEEFERLYSALPKVPSYPFDNPLLQHLTSAATIYQGDFLAHLSFVDCADLEEWIVLSRNRLQNQAITILQFLANHYESIGAFKDTQNFIQQALVLAPFDEANHRQLMRVLAYQNQRSASLHQYQTCRDILLAEFDAEPSSETVELHHQIQSGTFELQLKDGTAPSIELSKPPGKSNLPQPKNSFVGRDRELTNLAALLREQAARLITLVGPGGVGKTRLAIRLCLQVRDDYPDNVHFVDLMKVDHPDLLPEAILRVVGSENKGARSKLELTISKLRKKNTLLLLDNFEHLMPAAPVVAEMLSACPNLKVVITSRQNLRLSYEHLFEVKPLSLPADNQDHQVIIQNEAVRLFVLRAEAVQPQFRLTTDDIPSVVEICKRLDGLPLALELVASWARHFSVSALQHRLFGEDKLKRARLLKNGPRDLELRHQSLDNTIRWSYDLLTADEQFLLRHLAIFMGNATVDAVKVVIYKQLATSASIEDCLFLLVDKHVVEHAENSARQSRFWLLETVREFGLKQLEMSAELSQARESHAIYYLDFARTASKYLRGNDQVEWLDKLDEEHSNLRVAFDWLINNKPLDAGLRMVEALREFWLRRNHHVEALNWICRVLDSEANPTPTSALATTLFYRAYFAEQEPLEVRYDYFMKAAAVSSEVDDLFRLALSRDLAAYSLYQMGRYDELDKTVEQNNKLKQKLNDPWVTAMGLVNYGQQLSSCGLLTRGRRICKEGMTLFEGIDDRWGQGIGHMCLGNIAQYQKRFEEAHSLYEKAYSFGEELNDIQLQSTARCHLGSLAVEIGDVDKASSLPHAFIARCEFSNAFDSAEVLDSVAYLLELQDQLPSAVLLASASSALYNSIRSVRPPLHQSKFEDFLHRLKNKMAQQDLMWYRLEMN